MKREQLTDLELMNAIHELAEERAAAADIDIIDVVMTEDEIINRVRERRLR